MRFLWMFIVVFRVRCDDATLSTTTPRDYTEYPKPTLHIPTTFNNNDGENTTDTPLDLFRWKKVDTRRKAVDVWAWDLYCHLQPMKGSCKEVLTRYFYDSQMDTCNEFEYSGCLGNKNNFETILDCERRCKGANFMGVNENRLPTVCYLQADSGLCLAFMTNYYYDVNSRSCHEFTYGGCGGNLNRFETKEECEYHCRITRPTLPPMPKPRSTDVNAVTTNYTTVDIWAWNLHCHYQPVKGTCKEELTRYYYDAQEDKCNVFNYSGCHGNKNNFESIHDCERRCKGATFIGLNEKRLPTVCYLQAESGWCLAFITNYYYDVNFRSCYKFTYGGCGGNFNRFETKEECENKCQIIKKLPVRMKTTTTTTGTLSTTDDNTS